MSKISMELMQREQKTWRNMNEALEKSNAYSIPFGKYMNDKYNFNDKELEKEENASTATLIILKNHVKEIQ
jgi:hypothetical protein